ncbi:MAG: tautomerase family protein [Clostridia bacterium]|nr:tautomerase family protein [Clostridia bacterium]MBQ3077167.1 tautomerase family protein [Clostridia bacterium]
MPHIAVTMVSGRTDEIKQNLADKIHKLVAEELGIADTRVSVSIHDIESADWKEFINEYKEDFFVKPGYPI